MSRVIAWMPDTEHANTWKLIMTSKYDRDEKVLAILSKDVNDEFVVWYGDMGTLFSDYEEPRMNIDFDEISSRDAATPLDAQEYVSEEIVRAIEGFISNYEDTVEAFDL